jgi:BirA family transcriptional regulator, biotin operon repressor / biotin---[acetyl-CoA-carboxylase] ligase
MLHWSSIDKNNTLILDEIDSTNLFALERIKEGTANHGDVIIARHQTAGRGQRNNKWLSKKNEGVNMSYIVFHENSTSEDLPILNMAVSLAARKTVADFCNREVFVKWPNDIYVNNKKIGGILIENTWMGMNWKSSVLGIGLNVNTLNFPEELEHFTSLQLLNGIFFDISDVYKALVENLKVFLKAVLSNPNAILADYNAQLYRINEQVKFESEEGVREFVIKGVGLDGKINLIGGDGAVAVVAHGAIRMVLD